MAEDGYKLSVWRRKTMCNCWCKLLLILPTIVLLYLHFTTISYTKCNTLKLHGNEVGLLRHPHYKDSEQEVDIASKKKILAYTTIYGSIFEINSYVDGGKNPFPKCNYPCSWTADKSQLNSSDAVIFHLYNNLGAKDLVIQNLPKRSNNKQKWIFMAREPQAFYYPNQLKHLDDMFNLTVTFQRDSDVSIPYGAFWKLSASPLDMVKRLISQNSYNNSGNKKMVAWMASNCITSSRREDYIAELQKYIQVDTYGKCGTLKTPSNDEWGFREVLGKQYKFYLAFENADCDDYITEKFWLNSLGYGMIPVVRGLRNNYKSLAPPNSYIQADAFITPQKLANYLKLVASNETLFNSYHKWRNDYGSAYNFITSNTNWMCDLCEKIHTSKPQTWKISEHFGEDSRCFTYQMTRNRTGERVEDIFRV